MGWSYATLGGRGYELCPKCGGTLYLDSPSKYCPHCGCEVLKYMPTKEVKESDE